MRSVVAALALIITPAGGMVFHAIGRGYCRDSAGQWPRDGHTGMCGLTLDECEARCMVATGCAGYAHVSSTSLDSMGHCGSNTTYGPPRCVLYTGNNASRVTQILSAAYARTYTCWGRAAAPPDAGLDLAASVPGAVILLILLACYVYLRRGTLLPKLKDDVAPRSKTQDATSGSGDWELNDAARAADVRSID